MAKTAEVKVASSLVDDSTTFESFGLDARLLQSIAQLQFKNATLVQSKAIPLALENRKDIIARARTGSGKTAAYTIPIIQSILQEKEQENNNSNSDNHSTGIRALILVPTRELSEQVTKLIQKLVIYCSKLVKVVNLASVTTSDTVQSSLLSSLPEIIVATPSRARQYISKETLSNIGYFVIDEADLVLSYGYEDDLKALAEVLPLKTKLQTWLMSATLTEEVDQLKQVFCRSPAILKLEEGSQAEESKEDEKFLLAYIIFKLNLIKGKTIVFVNDIDRCYRLKLFLEQFGIKSCVLNSELPLQSRLHIVEEFNKNIYSLLIATDENSFVSADEKVEEENSTEAKIEEVTASSKKNKKNKKKNKSDKEYGVSRGVDFYNVACVLNFDLPTTSRAYTHRVGRTARAGKPGMALSFVVPKAKWGKDKAATLATAKRDEKVLTRIMKDQEKKKRANDDDIEEDEEEAKAAANNESATAVESVAEGEQVDSKKKTKEIKSTVVIPYAFDPKQVESFRYRMEDAFRSVTKVAIREARVKEIRQELITSDKLKRHFEENPDDLINLRHDQELHPTRVQSHLKRVPDYLLPKQVGGTTVAQPEIFVGFKKTTENRIRKKRAAKAGGKKKRDPLKTFRK
ncbi:DEAD-domain-containing protein [Nadsonia fulvescens var. elongata DSM 6958]|uniref:ATP-dependent RNA helicase DBP9 n=1 Tax=Nadsonia fulvescens var. elongata DSM 6958 TaxID=857566 RepID=A0A1E3PQF4_9ASCO|nr:DEAD-domain-containing protein [Nadsonia fulvescens var. elongata DSM 6958]